MKKVKLDLVGLDGNAFFLLGSFQKAARRQGWENSEIEAVMSEAKAGDYDHLLCTLLKYTEFEDTDSWEDAYDCGNGEDEDEDEDEDY